MASEPIECQVVVLKVSIHCEGCKKKVKKVLQHLNGVFGCDIDARSNKVTVKVSTKLDPYILVAKLRKSGKQAELWPEQPLPPQQPPAESQSQEPNSQNDDAGKPADDNAEASAAEASNPQPSPEPKQSAAGEAPKPAEESKEAPNADANANGNAGDEAAMPAPGQQHPIDPKGKARQQQPELERHPVDARVTMEYDRGVGGGYANRMPPPPQQQHQPVPIMSYNMARPTASASYYAPAPAPAPSPAPMPVARPGPSQGYIDEYYTPSYHTRSSPYEPYYYPQQPSPYRYQYQPASSEDYYYSAPPQRSAFSPPRDGYGDMFDDENANSCSVM